MSDLAPSVRDVQTEEQAGEYIDVPPATLRQWRYLGRGPAYVHVGRAVRYRKSDLDAWLDANTTHPTAS